MLTASIKKATHTVTQAVWARVCVTQGRAGSARECASVWAYMFIYPSCSIILVFADHLVSGLLKLLRSTIWTGSLTLMNQQRITIQSADPPRITELHNRFQLDLYPFDLQRYCFVSPSSLQLGCFSRSGQLFGQKSLYKPSVHYLLITQRQADEVSD